MCSTQRVSYAEHQMNQGVARKAGFLKQSKDFGRPGGIWQEQMYIYYTPHWNANKQLSTLYTAAERAQWPNEGAGSKECGNSEVLFGSPVSSCHR